MTVDKRIIQRYLDSIHRNLTHGWPGMVLNSFVLRRIFSVRNNVPAMSEWCSGYEVDKLRVDLSPRL